jgi:nicotinamide-nucleotide amidase
MSALPGLRAETITVGNELVRGQSVDTHSAWLAAALGRAGVAVLRQVSVGDDAAAIAAAVGESLARVELVVVTGGLGPTLDDLSREGIAAATGRPLEEDPALWQAIEARFRAAGRVPTDNNRRQALKPRGAVALPNLRGTAPGLRLDLDGRHVLALPGPPSELYPMFEESVLPWLLERSGRHLTVKRLQCYGLGESSVDEVLKGLVSAEDHFSLGLLAKETHVEIILSALAEEPAAAQARVEALEGAVLERLGERVYSLDGRSLAEVVVDLLKERGQSVALAESCTGGRVAAALSAVPGASEVFVGALVAYSNVLKENWLNVPPFVLKRAGAVSKDTALAMAVGLARRLGADYSLAVTGIAGPGGGSLEKPVGTVHFALAGPEGVRHQVYRFANADRAGVQTRATQAALWLLYAALADLDTPEEGTDRGACAKV